MKDNNNNSIINLEIQSLKVNSNNENNNFFTNKFNNKLNNTKIKLFEKISNLKSKRKKASNFSYSKYIDSNIYKNLFSFDKIGNTIFFYNYNNILFSFGTKNNFYFILYFLLSSITYYYLIFKLKKNTEIIFFFLKILFIIFIISNIYTFLINPGFPLIQITNINTNNNNNIKNNNNNNINYKYCNKCEIYINKFNKTVHCEICDICIEEYYKHSFLFGKCIGNGNKESYFSMIVCNVFILLLLFINFLVIYFFN